MVTALTGLSLSSLQRIIIEYFFYLAIIFTTLNLRLRLYATYSQFKYFFHNLHFTRRPMLTTYGLLNIVTDKRNGYSQDIKTIETTFHMGTNGI